MFTSPQPQAPDATPTLAPTGVRVASTLCWLVGILTILIVMAAGIPALASPAGSVLPLAINLVAGLAVCAGAVLIRRQRRSGVLIVVLAWAAPTVFALANHETPKGGSFLLFAAMLLSFANWKHLR